MLTSSFVRSCHDLNVWGLWDSLYHIIRQDIDSPGAVPEEIVAKAICCCSTAVLWFRQALGEHNPDKVLK